MQRAMFVLCLSCALLSAHAAVNINTDAVRKSVVFLYAAVPDGTVDKNKPLGTGFLVAIPTNDKKSTFLLLVTARHIVDPQWAFCSAQNPESLYIRINRKQYDPKNDPEGVLYVRTELIVNGMPQYSVHHSDTAIDAAALLLRPSTFKAAEYDYGSIDLSDFATLDELARIGISEPVISAGLVAGLSGEKRNYPVFKFGNVSSVSDEPIAVPCDPNNPNRRLVRVWFIAATLIPGNSGSPIFYAPPGAGGVILGGGVRRPVLIGVQSCSFAGDIAGMTPATLVFEVVQHMSLPNADLTRGESPAMPKP